MLPDRVSNPGPLTYESGALPIALRGPASENQVWKLLVITYCTSLKASPVNIYNYIYIIEKY